MPLISQSISSFKGGVSQQPDIIRFPDQVEELINGFPSEVEGLQKRPPTIHIARLGDSMGNNKVRYHVINRDEKEQYILEMRSGSLRVWDLQGNAKTVNIKEDSSYLTVTDPVKEFRAVTVADYTFILNNTIKTAMTDDLSPDTNDGKVLFDVRGTAYGKTYEIWLNGEFRAGVRLPSGSISWHVRYANTQKVAECLYYALIGTQPTSGYWGGVVFTQGFDQLAAAADEDFTRIVTSSAGWNRVGVTSEFDVECINNGSTLSVRKKDGSDFEYTIEDGYARQNFYSAKDWVSSENKLPNDAPDGFVLRIKGYTSGDTSDDYYVKWNADQKTWQETLARGIPYKIDAQTMPHALVREADGTFSFKRLEWIDRQTGDEDSNPEPTFITRTINDIFFYRNRLGFIADENIILSASADFFNFWFETATSVLDTDAIDVAVSSNKVSILTHAVPFSRELMLFAREGQFVLGSDGVLTPKSVKVDQVSSFVYNPNVQPINIGNSIYFINDRVNYCSLMRFYTIQDVADLRDAEDCSSHVPRYIPTGITRLSGNSTENVITCLSDSTPNTVYTYKFILVNGNTIQQSWFKWTFGTDDSRVLLADFINANIYMIVSTPSGLFLEKAELTGNTLDYPDEPVRLFMDRKTEYTIPQGNKYSDFNNYTEVSLKDVYGTTPTEGYTYFLVTPEGYLYKTSEWDDNGVFRLTGDLRGKKVFVGRQYVLDVTLSRPLIKQNNSQGAVVSEDEGRLMLRYFWFNYSDSGVFNTKVINSLKHKEYTYTCTSKNLGVSDLLLGVNKVFGGRFKFPVHELNNEVAIKLYSDNMLPVNIVSGGWEGMYVRRTQKV
nr:MAG TPA_asm: stabilization protein [Caudoviricetes sp.]